MSISESAEVDHMPCRGTDEVDPRHKSVSAKNVEVDGVKTFSRAGGRDA